MAVALFRAANRLNLKLFFEWKPRTDPLLQIVDLGSRGPWTDFDDFRLDQETVTLVRSRGVNLDGFASFSNKVVPRYISVGFQVEAIGTNFFTQEFLTTDKILIHPHPKWLWDALTHASNFQCEVVAVLHLWQGYPPYRNFLRGGHLPSFCLNRKIVFPNFQADSPCPAFTGIRNFPTCVFDLRFTGRVLFPDMLQAEGSIRDDCLLGGCYLCNLPCDSQ